MRAIKPLCVLVAASFAFLPSQSVAGEIWLKDNKGIVTFENEQGFVRSYMGLYANFFQIARKLVFGDGVLYFIVTSDCNNIRKLLTHPEDLALVQKDGTYIYDSLEDALKSDEFKDALRRKGESPYIISVDVKSSDMTSVYDREGLPIMDGKGYGALRVLKQDISCIE